MNAHRQLMSVESPTELAPLDRAERVLGFVERKAQLADLARQSERIVGITDTPGYQEAQTARMALKNTRVEIQKLGKAAREDATAFSKAVISKEKELLDVIEPEESRLLALQDEWNAAREAEKQARIRAEEERLAAIRAELNAIRDLPLQAIGKSADAIAVILQHARTLAISESVVDQREAAIGLREDAIAKLVELHTARVEADAEAARLIAERAELARLRAEQAAADQQAATARAEADRVAAAEREKAAREQHAKINAEAAQRAEAEAAFRAEREATDASIRALREAEAVTAKAVAEAETMRLRRERAQLERDQAEVARIRLERELAEVTLVTAATEARDLLVSEGRAHHHVTLKLSAALAREQEAV